METNEITQILSTPLTNGQDAKTAAFNHAADQQNRLVQGLQLEQKRAAALHGAKSPQAQRTQAMVLAHQQALDKIQAASARAQVRAPLANPKEFIVYGYVTGKTGEPVADVNVSAVTDKGKTLQSTASAADGSYALHLEGKEPKAQVAAAPSAATTTTSIQLVAADKNQTYQVRSETTFQFAAGKLAYQDLSVPV